MRRKFIKLGSILLGVMLFTSYTYCVPDAPPGGGSAPGGGTSSASVSYNGANTISEDKTVDNQNYSSTTAGQNSLLISGGNSTITNSSFTKSGDESDENSDFYGTNACILVYNGGEITIVDAKIETNGGHANGVFAYTNGTINISDSTIKTTGNNSGGIMVTGGGTLNASNLTVETSGNSSASIRSDRAGGTMLIKKGSYKTTGQGSPAIYSTANISVEDATLTSESSEGIVIEGANSVKLNNVSLTDTNNTLNGNSETYKNIFIYQSMSGDASEGTGTFTAEDSNIITNKGDTFYITNTTAIINLTNNTFENKDGDFLRAEGAKWGTSGSNGGLVNLTLSNQIAYGDIVLDEISTLSMAISKKSYYKGAINKDNKSTKTSLTIDDNSIFVLEGDTYLNTLTNSVNDNSNIYSNGYTLYINQEKVDINESTPPEPESEVESTEKEVVTNTLSKKNMYMILGSIIALLLLLIIVTIIKKNKKSK